jgi:hypothetical protein
MVWWFGGMNFPNMACFAGHGLGMPLPAKACMLCALSEHTFFLCTETLKFRQKGDRNISRKSGKRLGRGIQKSSERLQKTQGYTGYGSNLERRLGKIGCYVYGIQEAVGSIPSSSTKNYKGLRLKL